MEVSHREKILVKSLEVRTFGILNQEELLIEPLDNPLSAPCL